MFRRAALLAARRVAPLLEADGTNSSLTALKRTEPADIYTRLAEPHTGLQDLRQGFSSSALRCAAGRDASSHAQAASSASAAPPQQPQPEQPNGSSEGQPGDGAAAEQQQPNTSDSLHAELEAQRTAAEQHAAEAAEMKDKLLRTLADMENLRERSARQIDTNKHYAVQGFAKSLLDVADNLERAAGAVPTEALQGGQLPAPELEKHLRTLLEGVQLTDKQLTAALKQHGVEKYTSLGEKFDPNMHSALFEMPDPSKEPGTVGAVSKNGYMINGRVMRAADVGVVRAPPEQS